MNTRNQQGKVALVTGSSKNIGRAIAVALARQGCNIVVHSAQNRQGAEASLKLVQAEGAQGLISLGDLSDSAQLERIFSEIKEHFGRLDILVNNAAVRPELPFAEMTYADWRQVMSVNVDAVFQTTHAALELLQQSGQATIINIGGLTAHTGAANRVHVITSKSAIVGFTRGLAHELSPQGIMVNCVSPGLIDTVRDENNRPQHHASRSNLVNRRGRPEEVAEAVAYLCSESGRYITGQTIHVNGGAYLS